MKTITQKLAVMLGTVLALIVGTVSQAMAHVPPPESTVGTITQATGTGFDWSQLFTWVGIAAICVAIVLAAVMTVRTMTHRQHGHAH